MRNKLLPVQCWTLKNHSKKGCFYIAITDIIASISWSHEDEIYPSLITLTVPQKYHHTSLRSLHLQAKTLLYLPPPAPSAPQHTPFINRTCDDVVSLLWMMELACPCLTRSLPCVNKSYPWELGAQEMNWKEEKCPEGCVCCGAPIMTSWWL